MTETKRILFFGAAGQLGQAFRAQQMPAGWEIGAFARAEGDITDHGAVQKAILSFKPDIVVNAAAMTAVDKCEKDEELAMAVNFEAATNIATQCAARDIPLIHISTDYVFDGRDSARPYRVDDQMNPVNVYGQSKMMGEEGVRHEHAYHVILRISSVFSAFGGNLLTRTLQMLDEREEMKSVTDQLTCPTPAQDVAKAIITIGETVLTGKHGIYGTFHLCGEPACNRLEFTTAIMDAYAPYTGKRPKILPALSSDFPGLAERPAYTVMDCSRIRDVYGINQRPWRDGLNEAMQILMRDRRKVA